MWRKVKQLVCYLQSEKLKCYRCWKPQILHCHFLQINSVSHIFNMSVLKCVSRIAAVWKQIFIQYAVKLHRHSFQDKYVMSVNNFTSSSYCFQLPCNWPNIFKVLSVLFPYTWLLLLHYHRNGEMLWRKRTVMERLCYQSHSLPLTSLLQ